MNEENDVHAAGSNPRPEGGAPQDDSRRGDVPGSDLLSDGASHPGDDIAAEDGVDADAELVSSDLSVEPHLVPIASGERIASIDVLRGFALLGILVMNIYAFTMPFAAYGNPYNYGGTAPKDLGTWIFTHLFFDQKFITIFSMLFGAGLVVMATRAQARGARLGRTYYRRILWLLVIGAAHAYLLWVGDILFTYACCGLLLFLFRRRAAKKLIVIGSVALLVTPVMSVGFGKLGIFMRDTAAEVERLETLGETPSEEQEGWAEGWEQMREFMDPTEEDIAEQLEIHRGGYAGILKERAVGVFFMHTFGLIFFMVWRTGGIMLIGMGLMKLGVFSAERSSGFYKRCIGIGYGLGLPLIAYGTFESFQNRFDVFHGLIVVSHFNYFGSIAVALGHVGVVMLVCKSGALEGVRARLAAVGRMALSNYLGHSLICTVIFYGYGLGLFGHVGRMAQMGFVVAIWALQLWISPIWLRHFRFGPAEWLWRSLTYWQRQPMRKGQPALSTELAG